MDTNLTPYAKAWADAIKSGRDRKGYSRAELAAKLEVSYQAVQNWESGRAQPGPRQQAYLIGLLGISPEDLSRIALKAAADPNYPTGQVTA